jgi:hypothetical protein
MNKNPITDIVDYRFFITWFYLYKKSKRFQTAPT